MHALKRFVIENIAFWILFISIIIEHALSYMPVITRHSVYKYTFIFSLYPIVISNYFLLLQEVVTKMGRAARITTHPLVLMRVSWIIISHYNIFQIWDFLTFKSSFATIILYSLATYFYQDNIVVLNLIFFKHKFKAEKQIRVIMHNTSFMWIHYTIPHVFLVRTVWTADLALHAWKVENPCENIKLILLITV